MTPRYRDRASRKDALSNREVSMPKLRSLHFIVALSVAMPLAVADTAFAAKKKPEKLTYEQAWARCQKHVDTLARDQQTQRYTRGAACMKMFGYNI
jgi:hypothetical protein